MGQPLTVPIPIIVVIAAALVAALTDIWKFKVYNVLTLPLIFSGLIYHGVVGGSSALMASVIGLLLGFGLLIPLYLIGGMGAGDVKFFAGLGSWLGALNPLYVLYVFLTASFATGVYALALMVYQGSAREVYANLRLAWYRLTAIGRHLGAEDRVEKEWKRDDRRSRLIPFTAMIAVGLIATLLWAHWR